jgi:hypothetical protein
VRPIDPTAPRPPPARIKFLLGFVAGLLFFEAAARAPMVVRRLDLAQLRATWLASRPAPEVLIVGDSTAHEGISAAQIGQLLGQPALNAALSSGSPIVMRRVVSALPTATKRIVFGISPLLLSDSWVMEPAEFEAATLRERMDIQGWGAGALGTAWRLYGRRLALRQAIALLVDRVLDRLHPSLPTAPTASATTRADRDDGRLDVDSPDHPDPLSAQHLWNAWAPRNAAFAGARARALTELVRAWVRAGTRVDFVLMPVSSPLRSVGATHPDAYDLSLNLLRELSKNANVRVFDCRSAVADEGFYDADHLKVGALRDGFGERLARMIRGDTTSCGDER